MAACCCCCSAYGHVARIRGFAEFRRKLCRTTAEQQAQQALHRSTAMPLHPL
jgi:hypothetical protein